MFDIAYEHEATIEAAKIYKELCRLNVATIALIITQ